MNHHSVEETLRAPSTGIATFLIFLSGIMGSFSGVLIGSIEWSPWAVAGAKSTIGLLMTFPFLAYYVSISRGTTFSSEALALPQRILGLHSSCNLWKWLGVVSFVTNIFALTIAFQMGVIADAVFLHWSGFLVVAVFSGIFLDEYLSGHDWIAVAIGFTGIALLSLDGVQLHAISGTLLGLLACVTFAGSQLCVGKLRGTSKTGFEVFELMLLADFLTMVIGMPSMITATSPQPSPVVWVLIVLLGVVPWGIPNVLYLVGVKKEANVPMFRAQIMYSLDPVLTAVWAVLFIHQVPTRTAITGAALVITAMGYQAYMHPPRPPA